MSKTFVISDTHFYHDKLKEKYRPVFFNELIIRNWSTIVSNDDIVIHLGDVIFYKYDLLGDLINLLPGKKILITGNHDKKTVTFFTKRGFTEVYKKWKIIDNILFSHSPMEVTIENQINIYGHLHTNLNLNVNLKTHKLFSLEIEDYKPVELQEFINRTNDINYYINGKNSHDLKYLK